jgi:hypothetical protein
MASEFNSWESGLENEKRVDWVKVRSFESEIIKGSKRLLVSLNYSTRDSDLIFSLSVIPNSINGF